MRISKLTLYLLVCGCSLATAQNITPSQQKSLNDCVAYGNQSGNEVAAVVESLKDYYLKIHHKDYGYGIRYDCPIQLDDYYYNTATASIKTLGSMATLLGNKLKELRASSEKVDATCKALDTYHKLEDYKQDHFAKANALIVELQAEVKDYTTTQQLFSDELTKVFSKLHKYTEANAYYKTDVMFRKQLDRERAYLNTWTFNLNETIHSGWSVENLEQAIAETDKQCKTLAAFNPALKYPASSMIGSFREGLGSILETKRNALDGYNSEARKSDKHSNDAYLDLINYYDGALIADYNTYIGFATGDGYYGLGAIRYVPQFEIRMQEETTVASVKAYQDIVRTELAVPAQKSVLSKTTFNTLNLYLDFINEGLGQMDYLKSSLRGLNSDARYYKGLTSFKGKGGLQYSYDKFEVPLSLYQQLVTESAAIPAAFRKSLNDQAGVLLSILKEMDQWSALLEIETKEKRYEKDHLAKVFEALQRNRVLMETFDKKKELLYQDVRKIYESYPLANASSSWSVSGRALQKLVDIDHDALFKAREHYKGTAPVASISTTNMDETLRDIISKEYTNMKGIEKLGPYNGNCPYTPYEDIPSSSKVLSEKLNTLEAVTSSSYGYDHPYHDMVYLYNNIVDNLNKFSDLSKTIFLLKSINQPELFDDVYSDKEDVDDNDDDETSRQETAKPPVIIQKDTAPIPEKKSGPNVKTETKGNENSSVDKTKIYRDTIYIEKRDTIYIAEPGEDLHSMEGYASNNMILLLDVSGSMNSPEKLPLLKTSVLNLLKMMRSEDEVSIITYSGKANVLLKPTSFKDEDQIKKVIEKLKSEGKTDGNAGLKMAYKVADENYIRGGNNRIILATDGEFPISAETLALVEKFSKEDIFISVFNFGKSNTSGKTLEKLATTGKGNYEYITQGNVELKLIHEVKAKRKK